MRFFYFEGVEGLKNHESENKRKMKIPEWRIIRLRAMLAEVKKTFFKVFQTESIENSNWKNFI